MHRLQKHKILKLFLGLSTFVVLGLMSAGPVYATTCSDVSSDQQQQCSNAQANAQAYCNGLSTGQQDCSNTLASCNSQPVAGYIACLNAITTPSSSSTSTPTSTTSGHTCGGGTDSNGKAYPTTTTSIDIGCRGKGNPIMDATFGIIRFLSDGVGLVIVASMIYAGIQYSSSRGDPTAAAQAMKRIQSNVIALLIFIFGYAILNYVVPGVFLTSSTPTTPSTSQGAGQ